MSLRLSLLLRAVLAACLASAAGWPAHAQWVVTDPLNLIQTALNAARALEQISNQVTQITNQVRQLENDAKNLARLGRSYSPEMLAKLREMDQLLTEARGLALQVNDTRHALSQLYSGDYRSTDIAARAQAASRQLDAARASLHTSLLVQARATEQMRADQATLQALSAASADAEGALSAQQATNEFLAFQAQQTMRLQALLVAESRADALRQAREMEAEARARVQHEHFFSGAQSAHPGRRPWN
jgi:type IV secretion system protein TrbJ